MKCKWSLLPKHFSNKDGLKAGIISRPEGQTQSGFHAGEKVHCGHHTSHRASKEAKCCWTVPCFQPRAPGQDSSWAVGPKHGQQRRTRQWEKQDTEQQPDGTFVACLLWHPGRFLLLSSQAAVWGSHVRCWTSIRHCGPWHPGSQGDGERLRTCHLLRWGSCYTGFCNIAQLQAGCGWLTPTLGSPYRESQSTGSLDSAVSGDHPKVGTSLM